MLSLQELEDIAANYKRVAGFQVEGLNAKPPIVTMPGAGTRFRARGDCAPHAVDDAIRARSRMDARGA